MNEAKAIIATTGKSRKRTASATSSSFGPISKSISEGGGRQLRRLVVSADPDDDHALTGLMDHAREAIANGYQGEHQGFASMAQLFEVFTPKRWELIETLQRTGPTSLRGLARALGRDVKRVHGDAAVLLAEGVIERDGDGRLVVPFVEIHIDIRLKAPAA